MRITRVYTGDDNLSHFGEIELEFDPNIGRFPRAMVQPAREVGFNTQPADSRDVMHNAPERRFVIFMSGQVKVELSDGESRIAGAGDVILFEDVTGEGHLLTPFGDEPRYSMFVGLGSWRGARTLFLIFPPQWGTAREQRPHEQEYHRPEPGQDKKGSGAPHGRQAAIPHPAPERAAFSGRVQRAHWPACLDHHRLAAEH